MDLVVNATNDFVAGQYNYVNHPDSHISLQGKWLEDGKVSLFSTGDELERFAFVIGDDNKAHGTWKKYSDKSEFEKATDNYKSLLSVDLTVYY